MTKYVFPISNPICDPLITDLHREEYCDMKIKEKGLKGKAASHRRDLISRGSGFDAFREMTKEKKSSGKGEKADEPKKEIYLEFLGSKIQIHEDEEGNGSVKDEDVPFVKGATLKFDGCGGNVVWSEIKVRRFKKCYNRFCFIFFFFL